MLDLNFIRKNADKVKQTLLDLNTEAPIDEILELDEQRRTILKEVESLPSDNIPELLSTHPFTDKRIERLSTAPEPDSLQPFDIDWDSVKKHLK